MLPFLPLSSSAMLWIRLSRDFRNQLSKKLQKLLPRHIHISGTAEREQPQTSKSSSSYRAAKKQSAAYRAYRANDWGPVLGKVHRSSTWVKVQIRIIKYYSSKSKSTAFLILLEWKYKSTQFFIYLSKKVLIDRFILQFYIDYFI